MKGRIASMNPRSTAGASGEAGSQSIPDFAPPYGMSRTAILCDMVRARSLTSSSVTPGRIRIPPEHIPSTRRSITNHPRAPVASSCHSLTRWGVSVATSKHTSPERDLMSRLQQDDAAVGIRHAQHQHLGSNRSDLAWREVHHRDHQPAAEFLGLVMCRELGTRSADADWPKVDAQFVGRFARLRKKLGLEDPADADVDAREVRDIDDASLDQHP